MQLNFCGLESFVKNLGLENYLLCGSGMEIQKISVELNLWKSSLLGH